MSSLCSAAIEAWLMMEISSYISGILLAYSAFLVGTVSPGPNILAVIGTATSIGRRAGMALALGVAAGSFCWASLTASGLTALLASYAAALTLIKTAGGLYLLWLAYKAFRSAAGANDVIPTTLAPTGRGALAYVIRGFAIQITNPKAALTWIAIIALGLQENSPAWVGFVIVGGTTVLSTIIHCLYALAFSTAAMVRVYARARRWIQATLGALFAIAGVRLLTSRL
jgi:threonine/homoserine/homoserine lactone efflux protein